MSALQFLQHHRNLSISRIFLGIVFLLALTDFSFCQQQEHSDLNTPTTEYIPIAPPKKITLNIGGSMILNCSVIGKPFLKISWRFNSGDVPSKCLSSSRNGNGTLTCRDIQRKDAGKYSCEAENDLAVILVGRTSVTVQSNIKCPPGTFNDNAETIDDCISCFCFGLSNNCKSSKLFVDQRHSPLDRMSIVLVKGSLPLKIQDKIDISEMVQTLYRKPNKLRIWADYNKNLRGLNIPYISVPKPYNAASMLNSYGGYLKYTIRYVGDDIPTNAPDVIISGHGFELVHRSDEPGYSNSVQDRHVRFSYGYWMKNDETQSILASREEIMLVLSDIDHILIKAKYDHSLVMDTTIFNVVIDTAIGMKNDNEIAYEVEKCTCPNGFYGNSCENRSSNTRSIYRTTNALMFHPVCALVRIPLRGC